MAIVTSDPFPTFRGDASVWSPDLNLWCAIGKTSFPSLAIARLSADGVFWGTPNNLTVQYAHDICWSPSLGLFLAVGYDDANTAWGSTSPDGVTWTDIGSISGISVARPEGCCWSEDLGLFVVVCRSFFTGEASVITSPDGATWTTQGQIDGGWNAVEWSPDLGLFCAVGVNAAFDSQVMTSPDGSAWTQRGDVFGGVLDGGWIGADVVWAPELGIFVATSSGQQFGPPSPGGSQIMTSVDAINWVSRGRPLNPNYVQDSSVAYGVVDGNPVLRAAGSDSVVAFSVISIDGGRTWPRTRTPFPGNYPFTGKIAFGGGAAETFLIVGDAGIGSGGSPIPISAGTFTPAVAPGAQRFPVAPEWRFIVTDLDGITTSFLSPFAANRQIVYTLGDAAVATCDVPSDEPEVYLPYVLDGDPFVSMNNRLLYAFRRDGDETIDQVPWTCRFAGPLHQPNDEVQPASDQPITHLSAYDPWQYLNNRPVLDSSNATPAGVDCALPGENGVTYENMPAHEIVLDLLRVTLLASSDGPSGPLQAFIDAVGGEFSSATVTKINFRRGIMVGEAWKQIVQAGYCDIVLTPIYDPIGRPGICAQLNVYELAGSKRNAPIFSWDMPGRNLVGMNRLQDGTQMANVVQDYAGQGGVPVAQPTSTTQVTSLDKYGAYWLQKFYAGYEAAPETVEALAATQLFLMQLGYMAVTMDPAPELAPQPWLEWWLGDQLPVYANERFRLPLHPVLVDGEWTGLFRVYQVPVFIPDDAPEQIIGMTFATPMAELEA